MISVKFELDEENFPCTFRWMQKTSSAEANYENGMTVPSIFKVETADDFFDFMWTSLNEFLKEKEWNGIKNDLEKEIEKNEKQFFIVDADGTLQ